MKSRMIFAAVALTLMFAGAFALCSYMLKVKPLTTTQGTFYADGNVVTLSIQDHLTWRAMQLANDIPIEEGAFIVQDTPEGELVTLISSQGRRIMLPHNSFRVILPSQ
jgi:hypothetical protein